MEIIYSCVSWLRLDCEGGLCSSERFLLPPLFLSSGWGSSGPSFSCHSLCVAQLGHYEFWSQVLVMLWKCDLENHSLQKWLRGKDSVYQQIGKLSHSEAVTVSFMSHSLKMMGPRVVTTPVVLGLRSRGLSCEDRQSYVQTPPQANQQTQNDGLPSRDCRICDSWHRAAWSSLGLVSGLHSL